MTLEEYVQNCCCNVDEGDYSDRACVIFSTAYTARISSEWCIVAS